MYSPAVILPPSKTYNKLPLPNRVLTITKSTLVADHDNTEYPKRHSISSTANSEYPPFLYMASSLSRDSSLRILHSSNEDLELSPSPVLFSQDTKSPQEPLQLVKVTPDGTFQVCPEAASFLSSMTNKLAVISVGGPARTGKSFLLNLLIKSSSRGFEVSGGTKPCTQGIWLWGGPVDYEGKTVLFLDSEGSGSVEGSENHDGNLFALLMLVSSVFVFNSFGVIDEDSISKLAAAAYIAETLLKSAAEEGGAEDFVPPKFVWLCRDFFLSLVGNDEGKMSPKEYLENILQERGKGRKKETFNKVRKFLLNCFPARDCIVMYRPVERTEDLRKLPELSLDSLRPQFREQFEDLKAATLGACRTKRFAGNPLDGKALVGLVTAFVKAVNARDIPTIKNCWNTVLAERYEELGEQLVQQFKEAAKIEVSEMPYEEFELLLRLSSAKARAFAVLRENTMRDDALEAKCLEEFAEFYEREVNYYKDGNRTASAGYNTQLMEKLFKPIIDRLDTEYYAENFGELEGDLNSAIEQYEKTAKGPEAFAAMNEFSRVHQHSAFARFFNEVTGKYERKIEGEKEGMGDDEEKLRKACKDIEKHEGNRKILKKHVEKLGAKLGVSTEGELAEMLKSVREKIVDRM